MVMFTVGPVMKDDCTGEARSNSPEAEDER
jgi:hypothetical protein